MTKATSRFATTVTRLVTAAGARPGAHGAAAPLARTGAPARSAWRGAAVRGLAATLFFVACTADARLIRNGGRATVSNNSASFVLLAPDALVSGDILILPDGNLPQNDQATMEAGSERIYTVPDECFTFVGSDAEADLFNATNEDCRYEFFEGEKLDFLGFMDHFLPAAASSDVVWTIASATGPFSFEFPGGNTVFDTSNDFSSTTAALTLSAPAPAGLVVGEYEISARSTQTAPTGFSFFEYAFVTPITCAPLNGPTEPDVCFVAGTNFGDSYENFSRPTRVTILEAPEPPTIALFLLAAVAGARRRLRRQDR